MKQAIEFVIACAYDADAVTDSDWNEWLEKLGSWKKKAKPIYKKKRNA